MITSTNAGVDRFVAVNTADETPGTLEDKIDGVTIQVSDTDNGAHLAACHRFEAIDGFVRV